MLEIVYSEPNNKFYSQRFCDRLLPPNLTIITVLSVKLKSIGLLSVLFGVKENKKHGA